MGSAECQSFKPLIFLAVVVALPQVAISEIVHNFGDWRIEKNKISDGSISYTLVGVGETNDLKKDFVSKKFFLLKCFSTGEKMLVFPSEQKNEKRKKLAKDDLKADAYYWVDSNAPIKIPMNMINRVFL